MKKTFLILFGFLIALPTYANFVAAKNNQCKVFLRATEAKLTVNWHGDCKNQFADGPGVLRYQSGAKVDQVFYGKMKSGYWDLGVLDSSNGYVAGQFEQNELKATQNSDPTEDRKMMINAFDVAAKAALNLSKEFEKAGNKASAKHYKTESEKLSQQMD